MSSAEDGGRVVLSTDISYKLEEDDPRDTDLGARGRGPDHRPTEKAMRELAGSAHGHVTDQIREGGVCVGGSL